MNCQKQKKINQKRRLLLALDLRKYGTVPNSGFGIVFERLIMYITEMNQIRDVSAFPRTKCKKLSCNKN